MQPEDTRHHEVVTRDAYKLQSLIYHPDVFISMGPRPKKLAELARTLFPGATVVAEDRKLGDACRSHVPPGQTFALGLDLCGGYTVVNDVLREADFLAMKLSPDDTSTGLWVGDMLRETHRTDYEPPFFYAWRKPDGELLASRGEFRQLLRKRSLLGNAAEIGVAAGEFSLEMLGWGVNHLTLVDPWCHAIAPGGLTKGMDEINYRVCMKRIAGHEGRTTVLRMLSIDAAKEVPDGTLDFCYIDANHSYEGVEKDLPAWWPKVRVGGILSGHDYLAPEYGVGRAVDEFAAEHGLRVHLIIEHQRDASFWIEKP